MFKAKQEELLNLLEKNGQHFKKQTQIAQGRSSKQLFSSLSCFFLLLRQKLATPKGTAAVEPVLNPEACAFCLATQPRPCLRTCSRPSRPVHARVFEPAAPVVSSNCSIVKPVPSARATQRAHAFESVLDPRSLCLLAAKPVPSNLCSTRGACAFSQPRSCLRTWCSTLGVFCPYNSGLRTCAQPSEPVLSVHAT